VCRAFWSFAATVDRAAGCRAQRLTAYRRATLRRPPDPQRHQIRFLQSSQTLLRRHAADLHCPNRGSRLALDRFDEVWGARYPMSVAGWRNHWDGLTALRITVLIRGTVNGPAPSAPCGEWEPPNLIYFLKTSCSFSRCRSISRHCVGRCRPKTWPAAKGVILANGARQLHFTLNQYKSQSFRSPRGRPKQLAQSRQ
jgi:hypothetical protein